MSISRRAFLETTALGSMAAGPLAGADTKIPTRVLGKTGARVSILAMGGGSRFRYTRTKRKRLKRRRLTWNHIPIERRSNTARD
jgi:hypothetical protein